MPRQIPREYRGECRQARIRQSKTNNLCRPNQILSLSKPTICNTDARLDKAYQSSIHLLELGIVESPYNLGILTEPAKVRLWRRLFRFPGVYRFGAGPVEYRPGHAVDNNRMGWPRYTARVSRHRGHNVSLYGPSEG